MYALTHAFARVIGLIADGTIDRVTVLRARVEYGARLAVGGYATEQ